MTASETPLEMAARHVAEFEGRVERQRAVITKLMVQPSEQLVIEAEKLLTNMEIALTLSHDHLQLERRRACGKNKPA